MLKIKNGVVELTKTHKITPKQQARLNRLSGPEQNRYMLSLMGLIKSPIHIPKFKSHESSDILGEKPKGTILSKLRRLRNTTRDHVPDETSLGEWIGVEIECLIPHQGHEGENCECEFDDEGDIEYTCDSCDSGNWTKDEAHLWLRRRIEEAKVSRVSVKHDGSVCDDDNDGHGVEVTLLFNSKHGYAELEKLCGVLRDAGCYVNKTCGLHVHLDARHLEKRQVRTIGNSIGHALPVLKWMVPESRHDNSYCELGVSRFSGGRYFAVNLTAFEKYKTIEVRLHSGTCVFDKIKNWIDILKAVGAAKLNAPVKTFQDLMDAANLNDTLVEYAERRIHELNPKAWVRLNPEPQISVADQLKIQIEAEMVRQAEAALERKRRSLTSEIVQLAAAVRREGA